MRSVTTTALVAAALLAATSCAGTVTTVSDDPYGPDLVYAAPGVQVIADYDEPIFFTDGFYWRFYGGGWYRSSRYAGGWVYANPPMAVRRIDRPYAYAHYRPQGWVGRRERVGRGPAYREPPGRGAPVRAEPVRGQPAQPPRQVMGAPGPRLAPAPPRPMAAPPRPSAAPARGHDHRR